MDLWILLIIAIAGMCLIFLITKVFFKKPYSQKIADLYFDLKDLEKHGFIFKEDRYEGMYRDFHVTIFATSNMKSNDLAMVMIATDTHSGPIDFLKTFVTGYFKNPDSGGCTYVGFRLLMQMFNDPTHGVIGKLDRLIDLLNKKRVRPFRIG